MSIYSNIKSKPVSGRRLLGITFLFIVILLSVRLVWFNTITVPEERPFRQGVLDLRAWPADDRSRVALNGEWAFYPNQWKGPDGASQGEPAAADPRWIQVPGPWEGVNENGNQIGYGTYRLKLLVPDRNKTYGIWISDIRTAYRLYVNGELLHESGHPSDLPETHVARIVPHMELIPPTGGDELDIIVEVSNYQYADSGGIRLPIQFGTAEAVMRGKAFSENMQLLVCIVLLLHVIYVFILYLIGYRSRGLFYFAGLILFTLLATLSDDDKLLLVWLPGIPFEWAVKLKVIAYVAISLCLILCTKHLLKPRIKEGFYRAYAVFVVSYAAVYLLLPFHLMVHLSKYLTVVLLSAVLFVPSLARKAVSERTEDAIIILLSAVAVSCNIMISGILRFRYFKELPFYPIDLIVAFLGFASFWFIRFTRNSVMLREQAEQLQRADKMKDEFLANTSHELRNPLHGIINMAQTLLERKGSVLEQEGRNQLELITGIGRRMSLLLDDLLDVSLLKDNRVRLNVQSVHLGSAVQGVLDMLRPMAEGKRIELVCEIAEDGPKVWADESRLVQIMFNLIHNAIKYTEAGRITVAAEVMEGRAYVHVRDTGIGMDEKTLSRIFLPYEQGDSGFAASGGGLGLGLGISKQLVELHGGDISVTSAPSQGSDFTFTLKVDDMMKQENADKQEFIADSPASNPEKEKETQSNMSDMHEQDDAESEALALARPNDGRLLIVDDDPVNLKVIHHLLADEGYRIVTVTRAEEALQLLEQGEWDLIISDVMMPQMSGYELSRTIRQRYMLSELPILLLTARNRPEDIHMGFISGANDYLIKPVDHLELKTRVRALLELKRSIKERLHMEAAWLQAQIQPHFLHNTLNSIASLSEVDPSRMIALIAEFSHYLRASYDISNLDRFIPLEQELGLVRSYLYIEGERFGERLRVRWHISDEVAVQQWKLPPLTMQTIVENAVVHGVLARTQGGTVTIRIVREAESAKVIIADDGAGMDPEKLRRMLGSGHRATKGVGLMNTDRRLKQIYGQGLMIDSSRDRGTTVSFVIKKMA
ncbi:ATP-binding protein [Paenibacillus lautus]|uniref:ATP-binding protein n=1 Tax=Paenibacillus lautus TaxID=1401 RepID=UPI000BBD5BD2|nr:ATP-binding protein [Paenibacillus lautus]PCL90833.1 histidine kinase [Paenibacillus lautus]